MKAICIAHGGDMSEPSGGTNRVTAIAEGLADNGFDVHLVIPEPVGSLPSRLESVTIEFASHTDAYPLIRASRVVRAAKSLAQDLDARLQIEHSSLAGVGTLHGVKDYILDMHDLAYSRFDHVDSVSTPLLKRGTKLLENRAVSRANHIIVVSESMFDFLHESWNVPTETMTVIPNGFFPDSLEQAVSQEPVSGRVAFFGTLHPKVDVEILGDVAGLSEVSELVIIGDGARRAEVERLAKERDSVRATGRLPDEEAFEALGKAEVLINPQTISAIQRSSSPVKLYYYAALGKPMVVTSGPPIVEELVRRGAAGVAVSRGNFVSTVRRVLNNTDLAEGMGKYAVRASKQFEWSERVEQFVIFHESF